MNKEAKLRDALHRLAVVAQRCRDGDLPFGLAAVLDDAWRALGLNEEEVARMSRGCIGCGATLESPEFDLCTRCARKEARR